MVLDVAEVVEVKLGAGEGEPIEAAGAGERGFGFFFQDAGDLFAAGVDVGEKGGLIVRLVGDDFGEWGEGESAEEVVVFAVEGLGAEFGFAGGEIHVGAEEDVIGDVPEGVLADFGGPIFRFALGDGVFEHFEGCAVLAGQGLAQEVQHFLPFLRIEFW